MIPSLLGPGEPKPETKMALTNAVYFKGKWAEPFYDTDTRDEPFYVDGGKRIKARTMHQVVDERAARVDGALVLEKDYGLRDSRIVMDIILPNKRDGLAAIEEAYAKGALAEWLKKLEPHLVDVALPKVAMSSTLNLTSALRGLGVVRATSATDADFPGIDGGRNLFIDDQKAIVEIDETGAKAAAATYVGMVPTAAMGPPPKPPGEFASSRRSPVPVRDPRRHRGLGAVHGAIGRPVGEASWVGRARRDTPST